MGERRRSVNENPDEVMELVCAAKRARRNVVTPLTHGAEGAAHEDDDGTLWIGCNGDLLYPGHGITAERVTLCAALASGARGFRRIAVVGSADENLPRPCGATLEALHEHAPRINIVLFNSEICQWAEYDLHELLPAPETVPGGVN